MRITTGLATGNAAADDWAALCASPIILFNGIQQLRPPIRALLDTAPSTNLEEEVRWVSRTVPGVEGVSEDSWVYFRGHTDGRSSRIPGTVLNRLR
jgi:divalent metal cation (Fe/Co/Zn/Cd) transporter